MYNEFMKISVLIGSAHRLLRYPLVVQHSS